MSTDRNIEAAVQKELDSDPLVDAHDIVVNVAGGAVSLTGTVPSQAQRAAAEDTVGGVAGVLGITDEIEILGHT